MSKKKHSEASAILFRAIVLALLLLTPSLALLAEQAASGPAATSGRWLIDFDPDGTLQLTLKRKANGHGSWNSSDDYRVKDFQDLQRPSGTTEVPAHFQMVRDAGTFTFDGQLNASGGAGHFSFASNPEFLAALSKMGYRVTRCGRGLFAGGP